MIVLKKPADYELCQICTEPCKTKVVFEDKSGNSSTIKLCATCESELLGALKK